MTVTIVAVQLQRIIRSLRPYIGQLTEDFIAMQLVQIDERYVEIETAPEYRISLSTETPDISKDDLEQLLSNLSATLEMIVGPYQTQTMLTKLGVGAERR